MDLAAYRIIDANFNRSREALRTLDDIARFSLNSEPLCAGFKSLRHDLCSAIAALPGGVLACLTSRDTDGDVGTGVQTSSEASRTTLRDVAHAAAGRLSESLRSLEECCKIVSPSSAIAIESVRYRGYTLTRDLLLGMGTGICPQWRLCVLITESLCVLPWREVVRRAIDGGADCLQLREKDLEGRELLDRAQELVTIAKGTHVIINDRVDIALLSGAHGVHLGQSDLPVHAARKLAAASGVSLWIGVSTQDSEQATSAIASGCDYCGVGPMFPTTTKHKPVIAGSAHLERYITLTGRVPHLAIGGITPGNISTLAAAGCLGVAVSSVVCGSEHPEKVCAGLLAGLAGC